MCGEVAVEIANSPTGNPTQKKQMTLHRTISDDLVAHDDHDDKAKTKRKKKKRKQKKCKQKCIHHSLSHSLTHSHSLTLSLTHSLTHTRLANVIVYGVLSW